MIRPQDPQRPSFPFGNPFKLMFPKGSYMSPRLLTLLNNFEAALAERLKKLKPKDGEDVLSLAWMVFAMESLCESHADIKTFITELELPVCDWHVKWIDAYLDNSLKLLDICIAFSSELSRLSQGQLLLQCVLHNLEANPSKASVRANSSLDSWRRHITPKNPRLENCISIIDHLIGTLNLPKVKNSAKGKVLMQAMYGVKMHTLFICGIFLAAFSGSAKLIDLQVPDTCRWAQAFVDLQSCLNRDIRSMLSSRRFSIVKELDAVDTSVRKLHPMVQDGEGTFETEAFQKSTSDLQEKAEKLSRGLDLLTKAVDGFFQILLTGRDALLSNFRMESKVCDPIHKVNSVDGQVVR